MSERWLDICSPEGSDSLIPGLVCGSDSLEQLNPIDAHYKLTEHIVTLGTPQVLDASITLGRLLLLGLVSGTEMYFRSVLSGTLRICAVSRRSASAQQLSYGSIDYYGTDNLELGLLENVSFTSANEIKSRIRNLTGLSVDEKSSASAAATEFERLCQLRHAAVHADGRLTRGNAASLGLPAEQRQQVLIVPYAGLQHAAVVCSNTVRSFNRHLYRSLVERWKPNGLFTGDWASDREAFVPLFKLFHSRRDNCGPADAYRAYQSLPQSIRVR